jgi:single-stranded DNA-binding protein
VIDALVAGKLFGLPVERTAKNGNTYVTAKMRVPTRDGEAQFVNVVAFASSVVAALVAVGDGDAVALTGELTAKAYTGKDGQPRPSLELLAHAVLTPFQVQRRRAAANATARAEPAAEVPSAGTERELDDALPF